MLATIHTNASFWIVMGLFALIFAFTVWVTREPKTKVPPRIRTKRETDYNIAGGEWRRYRGFGADHRTRERVGLR